MSQLELSPRRRSLVQGACRRVESRTGSGLRESTQQNHGLAYISPLERRVDEIMRARRPIT